MSLIKNELIKIYRNFVNCFTGYGYGRFAIVKTVRGFIVAALKSDYGEVYGNRLFLDKKDRCNLSVTGIFSKPEADLYYKKIKEGFTVIDVGANMGIFTTLFARLVGKKGFVYAFEPEPANIALLKKNIAFNKYENVKVEEKAVSNKAGKINLYICDGHNGGHRIRKPLNDARFKESIEIEAISIDNYFEGSDAKIDFVKIDVEGAEYLVLKGMERIVDKFNPDILAEFLPEALFYSETSPEDYIGFFTSRGYAIYDVTNQGLVKTSLQELTSKYTIGNGQFTNIFATKGIDKQ
jgi:FkbM family methyltransferase